MFKARIAMLIVPTLLVGTLGSATAQDHRDRRNNDNFYNGVRDGGRNGYYNQDNHPAYDQRYRTQYNNRNYNNRDYNHGDYNRRDYHQGGIGPGKGALIGGAGGAVLGGLLGRGLGGALIGGAAGAGIGAIAGEAHQNHQRDQYGNYPR